MAARKKEKPPRSCAVCENRDAERTRVMKLLADAVKKMQTKLTTDDFKPTIADFLKLVQMEKEFGQEMAKEIRVTWVETPDESKTEK